MKKCPLCNTYIDASEVICLDCETENESPQIEKRKKGHVVDGANWWKVRRDKTA